MDLAEQSFNLLNNWDIFPRKMYFDQINRILQTQQIVFVDGKRRVWKSYTIMGYLQDLQLSQGKIFYFNKELDLRNEISDVLALDRLFCTYVETYWNPEYLVLDELHEIVGRERFVKAKFTEKKYKIIISGSNSQLILQELNTNLVWSFLSCMIRPLNYPEFIKYSNQKFWLRAFFDYLKIGWMPENVNKRSILKPEKPQS